MNKWSIGLDFTDCDFSEIPDKDDPLFTYDRPRIYILDENGDAYLEVLEDPTSDTPSEQSDAWKIPEKVVYILNCLNSAKN